MKELEERIAIKGVHCHECRAFVCKGRTYYQDVWFEYGRKCYKNHCVKCMAKKTSRFIQYAKKAGSLSRMLSKQYHKEDIRKCKSCSNRYKQVVGDCSPTTSSCKWKSVEGKCKSKRR